MNLPPDVDSIMLVALAGLLGGVIGFEREIADKPAGLRTHIFVAAAAALLVLLAEGAVDFFQQTGSDTQIEADPIRIIQAIVIGISFLGAGTIVHRRGEEVEGLTTAASIFLTASIGIAV
ncbi:MAG: MgtC/SapB family protein, partial [Maioricimonas sp. JB049]